MLFPYTYVPHQMEKMQEFIDFIFHEVWCKAPTTGAFRLELFLGNPDLYEVMDNFRITDTKGGDFFYSHVERIYAHFAGLSTPEIAQLKQWYTGNNDIEGACANEPGTYIVIYKSLTSFHEKLCEILATFFKGLYSDSLLDLAVLKSKIGDIDDHYLAFVKVNDLGVCPFCGISRILGQYSTSREAYDHYLPKAHYPFNSINFRNLVPACHHCNSSYKTSKNPVFQPSKHPTHQSPGGHRRKAFYPYSTQAHAIEIGMSLQPCDFDNLKPKDVSIQYGPPSKAEEIDTWRDVYGIDNHYLDTICSRSGAKEWLFSILDEWKTSGREPSDYLSTLRRDEKRNPWVDCRFLKRPFLEACERIGIFKPFPSTAQNGTT